MSYDIWGPWSSGIGPNAPLDDSCATTHAGSARSAVAAWTGANFPANQVRVCHMYRSVLFINCIQIVLGVPAYGHSSKLADQSNFALYAPFTPYGNPLVPSDDSAF